MPSNTISARLFLFWCQFWVVAIAFAAPAPVPAPPASKPTQEDKSVPRRKLTAPSVTKSQTPKAKQQQKDDLPDVSLVVPEDASPADKTFLKDKALALSSKRLSERLRAAQVLGELGEKGKPVRGLLCRTMLLDPAPAVRVAAADALKNIDSKMHYLAVTLLTEKSTFALIALLAKIQKLEEDGEPLAPLVAYGAIDAARRRNAESLLIAELTALSHIARNDLAACRLITRALTNTNAPVRATAMRGLARMKHGKLTVRQVISLLKTDPTNRIIAIETLTVLADESTEEIITDAISAHRYDERADVRQAVETARNELENKKQKP